MSTVAAFATIISAEANKSSDRCYSQPSDLVALEASFEQRFGDDCDAFPDAWRAVRTACKAAMMRIAKSGDVPEMRPVMLTSSSSSTAAGESETPEKTTPSSHLTHPSPNEYSTFPTAEHLSLLLFTYQYTSMGKAFADVIANHKINSVLLDMVTYRSMYLGEHDVAIDVEGDMASRCGGGNDEGNTAEKDSTTSIAKGAGEVLVENIRSFCEGRVCIGSCSTSGDRELAGGEGEEEKEDQIDPQTRQWLCAVAAYITGVEKVIANCSGSTAIALADTSLYLVRKASLANDTSTMPPPTPILPPVTEMRMSYSDYSVSETGARLWGGGVGLSVLMAEWGPMLLRGQMGNDSSNGKEDITTNTFVELGAGVALPTCVLARTAAEGLAADTLPVSSTHFIVTDVVAPILTNAKRNVQRQLILSAKGAQPPTPIPQLSTQLLDFFAVEAFVARAEDEAGRKKEGEEAHSSNNDKQHAFANLLTSADVVLATDIVYDYRIGKAGIATLGVVLRPCSGGDGEERSLTTGTVEAPLFTSLHDALNAWQTRSHGIDGGIALICCESHRDAMPQLPAFFAANKLSVLYHTKDVQEVLSSYTLPLGTTISACELFVVARFV